MANVDLAGSTERDVNTVIEFPKTGKPIIVDNENLLYQQNEATVVTPHEAEKDALGYTNPNLHRRIVDKADRSTTGKPVTRIRWVNSGVRRGRGWEIVTGGDTSTVLSIESCEYGPLIHYDENNKPHEKWVLLREGVDYKITGFPSHDDFTYLSILSSSKIIPEVAIPDMRLAITYICESQSDTKMETNDYSLKIQGVNSYRTTTYHIHDEVYFGSGTYSRSEYENEIP